MQRVAIGLVMGLVVACGGDDSAGDEGAGSGESSTGGTETGSEGVDGESSSGGPPALPPTCDDIEDFLILGSFMPNTYPDDVCGDDEPLAPAGTYGTETNGQYYVCIEEMSFVTAATPYHGDATGTVQATYLGAFRYFDPTDPNENDAEQPHFVTVVIDDYDWIWTVGCESTQWGYNPVDQLNVETDELAVGVPLCEVAPVTVVDPSDPSRVTLTLGSETCTLELHRVG